MEENNKQVSDRVCAFCLTPVKPDAVRLAPVINLYAGELMEMVPACEKCDSCYRNHAKKWKIPLGLTTVCERAAKTRDLLLREELNDLHKYTRTKRKYRA